VHDDPDALQSPAQVLLVPHVSDLQLRVRVEVAGCPIRMHLGQEHVQDADPVPVGEHLVDEVGSDEAGASGDEHGAILHGGVAPRLDLLLKGRLAEAREESQTRGDRDPR
jgi:hypothetical protein